VSIRLEKKGAVQVVETELRAVALEFDGWRRAPHAPVVQHAPEPDKAPKKSTATENV